jgi:hypothetical protein
MPLVLSCARTDAVDSKQTIINKANILRIASIWNIHHNH